MIVGIKRQPIRKPLLAPSSMQARPRAVATMKTARPIKPDIEMMSMVRRMRIAEEITV